MTKYLVGIFMVAALSVASAQPIQTESTNTNTNTSTSTNTNTNINESTNRNITESTQTIKQPPPTAVAPAVTTINNDVCAVVASGAVQTQIFGISMGGTMRDMNCERIKLAKNLFDMGMKVAAVATLCQDERVFTAMMAAGTPCPVDGKIGAQAREEWEARDIKVDTETIGAYAVQSPPKVVDTAPSNTDEADRICAAYRGDDPVVLARVCAR